VPDSSKRGEMQATVEQLSRILVLWTKPPELERLQPHNLQRCKGEIVSCMRAIACHRHTPSSVVLASCQQRARRETSVPHPLGKSLQLQPYWVMELPPTVTAECDSQILTVERDALLEAIRQTPEIALRMLMVFNSILAAP